MEVVTSHLIQQLAERHRIQQGDPRSRTRACRIHPWQM
jgi:hypothetical protein